MTRAQALRIIDEQPDFLARSVLSIKEGEWRMRNGHTAQVLGLLNLPYKDGAVSKNFPVWKGRCVECNEPRTWNINGTYAAVGKHGYDIVGPT